MVIKDNILVSVCMITYKHEEFIEQAINAILMQKIDFNLELLISDDNSPDNTEKIVTRIRENHIHGNKINYVRHKENKGMLPNFNWALNHCKGKYIALCEGDDYWTDPNKLQKQVDFLAKNKQISLCVHQTEVQRNENFVKHFTPMEVARGSYGLRNVLNNYSGFEFHTSSFVFRKSDFDTEFFSSQSWQGGDVMTTLILLKKGNIYYLNDVMSIYRLHPGGITNKIGNNFQKRLALYEQMMDMMLGFKTYYEGKHDNEIEDFIKGLKFYLAELNYHLNNHRKCNAYFSESIFWRFTTFKERKLKTILVLFVYSYFPGLFKLLKGQA
tara:strand:+ start:75 stop:1055 length:981 start_codon:yes stop_codon:yes gene_type:complete